MATKITQNVITRDEALALCPKYVAFVEGDHDQFEAVFEAFNKAKKGQAAITAYGEHGKPLVFVRVKISSVNADDIRAVDGPIVRVSNGQYSWRVDGDKYAHLL